MAMWQLLGLMACLPSVSAAEEQHFPDITFDIFSKFIETNFDHRITLATVLMLLLTMIENVDLLSLHGRQQNAMFQEENSVVATGWIKALARQMMKKMEKKPLLSESSSMSTDEKIRALGLKLDSLSKLLKLYPYNKKGKFKGKLKPVSKAEIQPLHLICPEAVICQTATCNPRSLVQFTRQRDIPLVTLIKGFTVHDHVPVVCGQCPKCSTLYYADHERVSSEQPGEYDRVYLNSAKYIKIGKNLWVDRLFTSAVLSGFYNFHTSAATYATFWNSISQVALPGVKDLARRHIWQAFVQESIRFIASKEGITFTIPDNLPINQVTKEAFEILGSNGIIPGSLEHSCAECTQKYRSRADFIPNANADHSATVGMEDVDVTVTTAGNVESENGVVKMVVVDGIVMGHTVSLIVIEREWNYKFIIQFCAYENCESELANARGGVYCAFHENLQGRKCHAANCNNNKVPGTQACQRHQDKWQSHLNNHRRQTLGGFRRALRRPDETWDWTPQNPQNAQSHDQTESSERQQVPRDHFIPPRIYCVETICAPCGAVVAWAKFLKSESPTNILSFLQRVYPIERTRPSYICIDKACMVLRTCAIHGCWESWLNTSRFIVDSYHYSNHRVTDTLCRKWCNPAPLDGSAPNLVVVETNTQGRRYYKRAFNTQACEQLNAWLGGYEPILKRMTAGNFDWFLHTMLVYHTTEVIKRQLRRMNESDESDESDDSDNSMTNNVD